MGLLHVPFLHFGVVDGALDLVCCQDIIALLLTLPSVANHGLIGC